MRVLITGGTNGMGKGVARALAARDDSRHEIIILGRSAERGASTVREIGSATKNPNLSFVTCDLARLSDVKRAIAEIRAEWQALDGVFINAGLGYAAEREETEDGMAAHFQVNYLSQFMLTLHLLDLLRRSERGGRVVFNVTSGGSIVWDDMQMKRKWSYVAAIQQAMVAKRMFYGRLHDLSRSAHDARTSFYGFEIPKTVWSNQVNIIPGYMRAMAKVVKWFGGFISIDECGEIMAPLFVEDEEASLQRSGKFITADKVGFVAKEEVAAVSDRALQEKLLDASVDLCNDDDTRRRANELVENAYRRAG
jgi:NAD(P)-dependent dehydrogenase (short-subunit alcohol dehydrogenase family)